MCCSELQICKRGLVLHTEDKKETGLHVLVPHLSLPYNLAVFPTKRVSHHSSCLSLWVVRACANAAVLTSMSTCRWRPLAFHRLPGRGLSHNERLPISAGQPRQLVFSICLSDIPVLGLQACTAMPGLLRGCWRFKSWSSFLQSKGFYLPSHLPR